MIFRLFLKGEFLSFEGKNYPRICVALKVRFCILFVERKNLSNDEKKGNNALKTTFFRLGEFEK